MRHHERGAEIAMSRIKKILLALGVVFIAIQFIQPDRNKNGRAVSVDFTGIYSVPGNVRSALKNACYDCHSNNTNYPWYTFIQPVGWIMDRHIKRGKEALNFSEFGNYTIHRQVSKLRQSHTRSKMMKCHCLLTE